ncbi:MAG: hypothetical protein N2053_09505 [Chitinispirillaceae bacterium]|nr:hypothetical protein [Chitinispirillaceae bacterium]
MWLLFIIIAIFFVLGLIFYITIELNELEKKIKQLEENINNYYGNK